jgi:anthranilate phosphoribosyltransferase
VAEPAPTWPGVLARLTAREDLSPQSAAWAMSAILSGEATSAQIAAFATGLRAKGETAGEVEALVDTMLAHSRQVDVAAAGVVLDVVGTGGDHSHSVNISTMAALVCAAAGATVVKHGNRAASSSTGTADVLEELGVVVDLEPDGVARTVREVGIGFCFAPVHHPAMRHAATTRRELGIPTVFNILGPLTNPAGAQAALIGCASLDLAPVMAAVLHRRGVRALVVRGEEGLDELSVSGPTRVWDATGPEVVESVVDAADWGIPRVSAEALRGGDRAVNADLLRRALTAAPDSAEVDSIRSAVTVNAAAALAAWDAATGAGSPDGSPVAQRIAGQLDRARDALQSGRAIDVLDAWIRASGAARPSAAD